MKLCRWRHPANTELPLLEGNAELACVDPDAGAMGFIVRAISSFVLDAMKFRRKQADRRRTCRDHENNTANCAPWFPFTRPIRHSVDPCDKGSNDHHPESVAGSWIETFRQSQAMVGDCQPVAPTTMTRSFAATTG
jgi:hypothetical protein